MSLDTIAAMTVDEELMMRCAASAAQEGVAEPEAWVEARQWELAAQPGWGAAYSSAVASHIASPGRWDEVISDGQITAAVHTIMGSEEASGGNA